MRQNLTTNKMDSLKQKNGSSISTIDNQKINMDNNITSIFLGQCETKLRDYYFNILENVTFYIEKTDIKQEGIQIQRLKFNIYFKLNSSNLLNFNSSPCEQSIIIFSFPAKLTDDINKLNSSSEYFKNKCYSAKSDSDTDITIKE